MWPFAATSARSTPTATSPTAAPAGFQPKKSAPLAIKLREVAIPGRRGLRRAGQGTSLRRRVPRRRTRRATWPTPIRRRPACRRWRPSRTTPSQRKTAEVAAEFVAASEEDPRRSAEGQLPARCAVLPASRHCRATKKCTAYGRRDCRLSDVQGTGPPGGHGHRRQGPNARRADGRARSRTGTNYDFFFIHFKYTDSTGEDGNFDAKVKRTEELDAACRGSWHSSPMCSSCTGDHSTPAC